MKFIKQLQVLSCLQSGKYKVDEDEVRWYHKAKAQWFVLKPNVLPTGYKQITLCVPSRKGKGLSLQCYLHQAIFLSFNGTFDPTWQIDHKDNDHRNNLPSNLRAVPISVNLDNRPRRKPNKQGIRTIRSKEIEQIKELVAAGFSQSSIAKQLDLNRCSVRYTIKQIEAGKTLKYS